MTDTDLRPPRRAAFLDYPERLPGPKTHELDAAGRRASICRDARTSPSCRSANWRRSATSRSPAPPAPIPARLFDARASREPGPALVFFHGGGFVIGDLDTHASFCAEVARMLDLPVISVDYRLAPEHRWPAAPDDCEAAARWVAGSPAELGRTVTSLVLMGDSAGGNLAIVTAMALRDRPAAVPVIVQAPIYPATDWPSRLSLVRRIRRRLPADPRQRWPGSTTPIAADPSDMRASPLLADLAGLPPAVVVTASLDPIRDQGRAYAAALIAAGVPVTFREAVGNIHGFITLRQAIPSAGATSPASRAARR